MAQHFLLSAAAVTLSLMEVFQMSDAAVENTFKTIRWPETKGEPVCPNCSHTSCYQYRRPSGLPRFRCAACLKEFSITSGTLFHSHKKPLRTYLAAIVICCNEVKGKAALPLRRDLMMTYKTAFVMAHKIREAMSNEVAAQKSIGGPGKTVAVDGAHVGGHVRPANKAKNRIDRRRAFNRNGKEKCVVVAREHNGRTVPFVFASERDGLAFINNLVARESKIMVDESPAWKSLRYKYEVKTINHKVAYSMDGACTNQAESFFSRLRRAERGHHHRISGTYLERYAQESAWREDHRHMSNGAQAKAVLGLALKSKPSLFFCGYWQRINAPKLQHAIT